MSNVVLGFFSSWLNYLESSVFKFWFSYQIETSRLALASLTTTRFQNMLKSQQRLVESQIYSQLWVVFQNEITVQNQITSRFGTKWDGFSPDLYLLSQASIQTTKTFEMGYISNIKNIWITKSLPTDYALTIIYSYVDLLSKESLKVKTF